MLARDKGKHAPGENLSKEMFLTKEKETQVKR